MTAFEIYILYYYNLDICSYCSGSLSFCHDYWIGVNKDKKPKFCIFNKMLKLYYQYYFVPLQNLTSAKEAVITRAHPIVTILKLRSNNSFNPKI